MPNIASAKKRLRQSLVRASRNKSHRSQIHTLTRKFNEAIESGDKEAAKTAFAILAPRYESFGRRKLFHRGTVSRRISGFNARLKRLVTA